MTDTPETLVCIDFINEIVDPSGKLAAKGYADFVQRHATLDALSRRQVSLRDFGGRVIHVHLGFAEDYADCPSASPLLSGACGAGILRQGTKSTAIHEQVRAKSGDIVLVKKRISAFHGTALEVILRSIGAHTLTIAGVSTDLAVQSAARDAHDRDFAVQIAEDSCAAANDDEHRRAIENLAKFATII